MRKIKQFRYYSEESGKNSDGVTSETLESGATFQSFLPIVQLGIQALPGTKFYINQSVEPIIIGSTGIYEIDLSGQTEIDYLSFDSESIANIDNIESAMLIVDIIYEGEDD